MKTLPNTTLDIEERPVKASGHQKDSKMFFSLPRGDKLDSEWIQNQATRPRASEANLEDSTETNVPQTNEPSYSPDDQTNLYVAYRLLAQKAKYALLTPIVNDVGTGLRESVVNLKVKDRTLLFDKALF